MLTALGVFLFLFSCEGAFPTGEVDGSIQVHDNGRVDLEGLIEQVGSEWLTVYSHHVVVTGATDIRGDVGTDLRFDDLLVGMWVEVDGSWGDDSEIVAERIDVEVYDHDRPDTGDTGGDPRIGVELPSTALQSPIPDPGSSRFIARVSN